MSQIVGDTSVHACARDAGVSSGEDILCDVNEDAQDGQREVYRLLGRLGWFQRLATDGKLHDLSSWTLLIGVRPEARQLRLQLLDVRPTPANDNRF